MAEIKITLEDFAQQIEAIARAKAGYLELIRVGMSYEMARVQLANMHKCTIGAATDSLHYLESLTGQYLEGSPNSPAPGTAGS
jgi:hypothetical protein